MKVNTLVLSSLSLIYACSGQINPPDLETNKEAGLIQEPQTLPDLPKPQSRNIFVYRQREIQSDKLQHQWQNNWQLVGTFSVDNKHWQAIVHTRDNAYILATESYSFADSDLKITSIDKEGITLTNDSAEVLVVKLTP